MNRIELMPWAEGDLWLLERTQGDPEMTRYLGGAETAEQLSARHRRYLGLNASGEAFMRKVVRASDGAVVGSIGLWSKSWQEADVFETGWAILPEHQGQGLATDATLAIIDLARTDGRHEEVHAFPNVDNAASNAICRKAGFINLGLHAFEFPKGHWMTCNDWRLDLRQP